MRTRSKAYNLVLLVLAIQSTTDFNAVYAHWWNDGRSMQHDNMQGSSEPPLLGGPSAEKPIDDKLLAVLKKCEPDLRHKVVQLTGNPSFDKCQLIFRSYLLQVVAGMLYYVRFNCCDQVFHARIFYGLDGDVTVEKVIGPKREEEPLQVFD